MSKPKLTPWFPPEVRPVHVGVYRVIGWSESEPTKGALYSYWNGKRFGYRTLPAQEAFRMRDTGTDLEPQATWCGLAEKP